MFTVCVICVLRSNIGRVGIINDTFLFCGWGQGFGNMSFICKFAPLSPHYSHPCPIMKKPPIPKGMTGFSMAAQSGRCSKLLYGK